MVIEDYLENLESIEILPVRYGLNNQSSELGGR